ncbi:MAG: serpin family protein [Ardenticatenaceae bacterium]|nr:serpin family protein [Ardenticatenaceae bacterium]
MPTQEKISYESEVVQANTTFALELYDQLREKKGNLFFSPYSVSTAMAMTYAGARGNTAAQMAQVLHFPADHHQLHPALMSLQAKLNDLQKTGALQLRVANALWPKTGYPFLKEYIYLIERYYGVTITPLDYADDPEAARQVINKWAEEKTENKIQNLIPTGAIDRLTRLILTNAIYFKGSWANQFDPDWTTDAPFSITPEKKIMVPMMNRKQMCGYAENDRELLLELPYVDDSLSMIVLLPREIDGLARLEESLVKDGLTERLTGLRREEVQVFLPRFKVTSSFRLSGTMPSMGMIDAFDENLADFSGIDGVKHWLYITAMVHKAFINVNEEGSEAAAATGVILGVRSAPPPVPVFRADHPFLFLIRENSTGSILFLGRVVNPPS